MSWFQAIVLGLVQGLTELLPVSSSGHLAVVPKLLGWDDHPLAFDVAVHVGTAISIGIYFRRDLAEILSAAWRRIARRDEEPEARERSTAEARLLWLILLASVPAAIAGLLFDDLVEAAFGSIQAVGVSLFITAGILWASEWMSKRRDAPASGQEEPTVLQALLIGLAQTLALMPGISRSGSTIGAGMALGIKPDKAVRFAFLMSLPVILGGGLLHAVKMLGDPEALADLPQYLVGMAVAGVSAWFAVSLVFGAVRRGKLVWFSVYCLLVGVICLVVGFLPT